MKTNENYITLFSEQLDEWNSRIDAQIEDLKNNAEKEDDTSKSKCFELIDELNLKKIFLYDRME